MYIFIFQTIFKMEVVKANFVWSDVIDFIWEEKMIEARERDRGKRGREGEKESCISSWGLSDTRVPQVFQFNESL